MFPFLYRVASASARTVPFQRGKLASSFAGRRASVPRWIEWASLNRTKSPLIWVHGASVGENLSATAVVTRLRSAVPGLQVVHSYTSPSAIPWREIFDGCRADFLPPEEPDAIARVLAAMRPDLIAFSRGDIWPVLTRTAAASGIPVAVIGGTVNPSSLRLWPLIRNTLTPTYRLLDWLGAASRGDADRWSALGMSAQSIDVTGDPRHDQVLERHTNIGSISSLFQWCGESPVLVAGSTDKRDEEILLHAFAQIVSSNTCCTRLMIVPHENSRSRIDHVRGVAHRHDITAEVWNGAPPAQGTRCVIVEKMGVLADLYALGEIAYVGGGFGRKGLHTVIEPAAFALPVIAGPEQTGSPDFQFLLNARGSVALPREDAAKALQRTWTDWANDAQMRTQAGLRARQALQQGAATTTAVALLRLISSSSTVNR